MKSEKLSVQSVPGDRESKVEGSQIGDGKEGEECERKPLLLQALESHPHLELTGTFLQNQEKLMEFLRRIQQFGVQSKLHAKKEYLYSGSWMNNVKNYDDFMGQINGSTSSEACMKVFNLLFPYPEKLDEPLPDVEALT